MSEPDGPPPARYDFVDDAAGLERLRAGLDGIEVLAVDTEADSLFSFKEKVCLIQLATDRGDAFIVDPLALDSIHPLPEVLADPNVVKLLHGADFDVVSLKRDFDVEFENLFDTMVASQLLGDEQLSLQSLVERFIGVRLAKAHTRCNWGKRPLGSGELAYAYYDVAFLVEVYDRQLERLQEADLQPEAEIEFDRLAERTPTEREFDPHGWARIKGARDLPDVAKAVLAEIYRVRNDHAEQLDRPLFKVIGNDTMKRIATRKPRSVGELRSMKGLSRYAKSRMAQPLVAAVQRGVERGRPESVPASASRKNKGKTRLDAAAQRRMGRIREWRQQASERTGLTTLAILPNYAMNEVARLRPRTLEELAAIEGVEERRASRWGEELLPLLR